MKSRWIASMVCLLYLSVGILASEVHHHDADSAKTGGSCALCAWHHDSQIDVPSCTIRLERQIFETWVLPAPDRVAVQVSLGIHPSRGPPALSL